VTLQVLPAPPLLASNNDGDAFNAPDGVLVPCARRRCLLAVGAVVDGVLRRFVVPRGML
jgi:hypothetical protein